MKTPRPYQSGAVDAVLAGLEAHRKWVLQAPTGAGKTLMACMLIERYLADGWVVVFVVDQITLIRQAMAALSDLGVQIGAIWAEEDPSPMARGHVASVQTIEARAVSKHDPLLAGVRLPPGPVLVILDECHDTAFRDGVRWHLRHLPDGDRVLGLTATPFRPGLADLFGGMTCCPGYTELIAGGYLVPIRYVPLRGYTLIDETGLDVTALGEFRESDLVARCGAPEVLAGLVTAWQEHGEDRITAVFCPGVETAEQVARVFYEAGIVTAVVTGTERKTYVWGVDPLFPDRPRKEVTPRQEILAAHAAGDIRVLVTVRALDKGWDSPPVGCLILVDPIVESLSRYVQRLGRGMRPFQGKADCIFIDLTHSSERFGRIEDLPAPVLLPNPVKGAKKKKRKNRMKRCPECGALVLRSVPICLCGYRWPASEVTLDEPMPEFGGFAVAEAVVKAVDETLERARTALGLWLHKAIQRGYHPNWAAKNAEKEVGGWPTKKVFKHAALGPDPSETAIGNYRAYLERVAARKYTTDQERSKFIERFLYWELGK